MSGSLTTRPSRAVAGASACQLDGERLPRQVVTGCREEQKPWVVGYGT